MESLSSNSMLVPTGHKLRVSSALVLARGTARRYAAQ
jgi:hypothetical protein